MTAFGILLTLASTATAPIQSHDQFELLRDVMHPYLKCERTFDARRLAVETQRDAVYKLPQKSAEEHQKVRDAFAAYNDARNSFRRDLNTKCNRRLYFDKLKSTAAKLHPGWSSSQVNDFAIQFSSKLRSLEEMTADYVSGRKPAPRGWAPAPPPSDSLGTKNAKNQ